MKYIPKSIKMFGLFSCVLILLCLQDTLIDKLDFSVEFYAIISGFFTIFLWTDYE